MNKISYLRKCIAENYEKQNYKTAADYGETLIKEHFHNRFMRTRAYADDLYNLALIYDDMGELERAAGLLSDSARYISILEGESIDFAARLTCLAVILGRMGAYDPAFFMHAQVTHIYKTETGHASPEHADSLYNLANSAADLGRRKEALKYHLDALKIREKLAEKSEELSAISDVIHSLHSIAFLHEASNDMKKAASYAEAAMEIADGSTEFLVSSCHYLAGIYERLEKYEEALPLYDKVQAALLKETTRDHSAYLNVTYRRAHLLAQLGRPRESIKAHEEICHIFQTMAGQNHIFYANCLRNRALLHNGLGETTQAESLILESMKIRKATDDITSDIIFLIKLYLRIGDREKAMEALIYALMRSDSTAKEFSGLITALTETFAETGETPTSEIMDAMEMLNDKERIEPIISNWNKWEVT